MTEELKELLQNLQEVYGISDEDINAVEDAIDVTIQEAVGGNAGMEGEAPEGMEGEVPPEAVMGGAQG